MDDPHNKPTGDVFKNNQKDPKDLGGRPRIELGDINLDGWKALDALIPWTTAEYCAEQLGISEDTLGRRIKEMHGVGFAEYKVKKSEAIRINLRRKQYDEAISGNTTMLVWLGKNMLSQTDKVETELNTKIEIVIDNDDNNL